VFISVCMHRAATATSPRTAARCMPTWRRATATAGSISSTSTRVCRPARPPACRFVTLPPSVRIGENRCHLAANPLPSAYSSLHLCVFRRCSAHLVLLPPAAEHFDYPVVWDVRDIISVDDVAEVRSHAAGGFPSMSHTSGRCSEYEEAPHRGIHPIHGVMSWCVAFFVTCTLAVYPHMSPHWQTQALNFGPNGGLIYCMEFLLSNLEVCHVY